MSGVWELNMLLTTMGSFDGPLKTQGCHVVNFVVTDGTGGCRHDNLRCHQWRQSWHHDNSRISPTEFKWKSASIPQCNEPICVRDGLVLNWPFCWFCFTKWPRYTINQIFYSRVLYYFINYCAIHQQWRNGFQEDSCRNTYDISCSWIQ